MWMCVNMENKVDDLLRVNIQRIKILICSIKKESFKALLRIYEERKKKRKESIFKWASDLCTKHISFFFILRYWWIYQKRAFLVLAMKAAHMLLNAQQAHWIFFISKILYTLFGLLLKVSSCKLFGSTDAVIDFSLFSHAQFLSITW